MAGLVTGFAAGRMVLDLLTQALWARNGRAACRSSAKGLQIEQKNDTELAWAKHSMESQREKLGAQANQPLERMPPRYALRRRSTAR